MAKPVRKGPTIGLRFDLEVDAEIRERAARHGLSPGQFLVERITASFTKPTEARKPETAISRDDLLRRTSTPRQRKGW